MTNKELLEQLDTALSKVNATRESHVYIQNVIKQFQAKAEQEEQE